MLVICAVYIVLWCDSRHMLIGVTRECDSGTEKRTDRQIVTTSCCQNYL